MITSGGVIWLDESRSAAAWLAGAMAMLGSGPGISNFRDFPEHLLRFRLFVKRDLAFS